MIKAKFVGTSDDFFANGVVYGEWRKYDKSQSREQKQEASSQGKNGYYACQWATEHDAAAKKN